MGDLMRLPEPAIERIFSRLPFTLALDKQTHRRLVEMMWKRFAFTHVPSSLFAHVHALAQLIESLFVRISSPCTLDYPDSYFKISLRRPCDIDEEYRFSVITNVELTSRVVLHIAFSPYHSLRGSYTLGRFVIENDHVTETPQHEAFTLEEISLEPDERDDNCLILHYTIQFRPSLLEQRLLETRSVAKHLNRSVLKEPFNRDDYDTD